MQVSNERGLLEQRRGRLVQRRQVVEMQDRRRLRPRPAEDVLPGACLMVAGGGGQGGEDRVWRPRPVLEGGMHRDRLGHCIASLGMGLDRRVVRHRGQQVVLEEARGVAAVPRRAERPRHQGDGPAGPLERRDQVSDDLRRTTSGVEQQPHSHGRATHFRGFSD